METILYDLVLKGESLTTPQSGGFRNTLSFDLQTFSSTVLHCHTNLSKTLTFTGNQKVGGSSCALKTEAPFVKSS